MLLFLEEARKLGATAVAELEIEVAATLEGRPVRCKTLVGPEEEVEQRARVVHQPGRYDRRQVLKPVSRYVTEQQYRCRPVQKSVTRYETTYEQSYDFLSKRYRSTPRSRPVTRWETQNECKFESVHRHVTRYEYEWESRWVPPEWQVISEHYSHWTLVESEPVCADAADADAAAAPRSVVRGIIYRARVHGDGTVAPAWRAGGRPAPRRSVGRRARAREVSPKHGLEQVDRRPSDAAIRRVALCEGRGRGRSSVTTALWWPWTGPAVVPKASDEWPEPETPVKAARRRFGQSTLTSSGYGRGRPGRGWEPCWSAGSERVGLGAGRDGRRPPGVRRPGSG